MQTYAPILSEWPSLPSIRPSGLVMLSIAYNDPVGLNLMSYVALPSISTYCAAICPLAVSARIVSSVATNLPSPCDIATVWISPTRTLLNQGDFVEAILVCAMQDTYRPIVF